MKKISALLLVLAVSSLGTFNSCTKKSFDVFLSVVFGGATHSFNTNLHHYVYQSFNYTNITGSETSGGYNYDAYLNGITAKTYTFTPTSLDYLRLSNGTSTYSTHTTGGSGSLTISRLDESKMESEGTFSGTLVNVTNPADVLTLTDGKFGIKYEF